MSICVENLSPTVTVVELEEAFSLYGVVRNIQLPVDCYTGILYGFAFVEMRTELEEIRAIKALNRTSFMRQTITVTKSRHCR